MARYPAFTNRQDMALFAASFDLGCAATAGRTGLPVAVKLTKTTKTA